MKALVYHAPGEKSWQEMPEPQIQKPTDAIVRIDTTTICGTDLHIMKGDVPAVTPGRILGHEGVGEIVELGSDVTQFAVGDKVIAGKKTDQITEILGSLPYDEVIHCDNLVVTVSS